jgi:ectoine hydroxylase
VLTASAAKPGAAGQHWSSLRRQEIGTPDQESLNRLTSSRGIRQFSDPAGSAVFFDCNAMHWSNGNITTDPRSNVFIVYNSVENTLVEPLGAPALRPGFIAGRRFEPV